MAATLLPTSAVTGTPGVLVVIVNYRTGRLVSECLASLEPEIAGMPGSRVVVVDNDSPDDSAEVIAACIASNGWNDWARLERAGVNGGFAFGNNLAVRAAMSQSPAPDYYWLLNPDTLVRPGALIKLVQFLAQHPDVGIAGSALESDDGSWWPFAFRFPTLWSEIDGGLRLGVVTRLLKRYTTTRAMTDQPERVDWLPGASMMVRKEVFQAVGLMDEEYFLYFEETDFFIKAFRAGWPCWYVPDSRVMHISGQSTGVTGQKAELRRLPAYWFESRRRYFMKNHGWAYCALADFLRASTYAIWSVRWRLQRKPRADPPHYLRDLLAHSAFMHWKLPLNPMLAKLHDGSGKGRAK
jgi:GT2 family glycosyltransferase